MKLLILTQKIDVNDDLLGFFHRWVEKLAPKFEKVSVLALGTGEYHLPENVKVFSLGKSVLPGVTRFKKIKYVLRFFKIIWRERKSYDLVFVHMNVEYVLLGGIFWRILGKKIVLWYAHFRKPLKLQIAGWLSHRILTSTRLACRLNSRKVKVLQQGIDIDKFRPHQENDLSCVSGILYLGRVSGVKNVDTLVNAFSEIRDSDESVQLDIVGEVVPGKEEYLDKIKNLALELKLGQSIKFFPGVSNSETPRIYNSHGIFVNLTASGSFDKTTLEAMACGLIIFVSNLVFEEILPPDLKEILMFKERDSHDLAQKILNLKNFPPQKLVVIKQKLRQIIIEKHNLDNLIDKLADNFKALSND